MQPLIVRTHYQMLMTIKMQMNFTLLKLPDKTMMLKLIPPKMFKLESKAILWLTVYITVLSPTRKKQWRPISILGHSILSLRNTRMNTTFLKKINQSTLWSLASFSPFKLSLFMLLRGAQIGLQLLIMKATTFLLMSASSSLLWFFILLLYLVLEMDFRCSKLSFISMMIMNLKWLILKLDSS